MEWRAPGSIGEEVEITLTLGDSVVLDTTVVVGGAGQARTRPLPVAEYSYRIARAGEDGIIGGGRIESEGHSLELLRRPVDISARASDEDEGRPTR